MIEGSAHALNGVGYVRHEDPFEPSRGPLPR
nr:MAG TPA: hypothetical protein [Caudoviricetes sp.]